MQGFDGLALIVQERWKRDGPDEAVAILGYLNRKPANSALSSFFSAVISAASLSRIPRPDR